MAADYNVYVQGGEIEVTNHPMSLSRRDYFAGLAMQGLLAMDDGSHLVVDLLALRAINIADALIKELDR